jgi:thioredoxin 1
LIFDRAPKIEKMKTLALIAILVSAIIVPANISGQKSVKTQNSRENVLILTDQNFAKTIKSGLVMVDFWATWCGPCRIFAPRLEEIALEMGKKVVAGKLDTDRNQVTSMKYNIRYLPTIILFKNGTEVKRFVGLQEKETIVNAINELQ